MVIEKLCDPSINQRSKDMKNKKIIEVEIRGPLSIKQLKILSAKLKGECKFLGKSNQRVIFFQENKILKLPKDCLRIKQDENGELVCFKFQNSFDSCQELEFFLKKGEYQKAIFFFQKIGFLTYSTAPAEREDFLYKNMKISLKNKCIMGPHYEIEKIINQKSALKKTKKELLSLAKEFNLKVWDENEYLNHRRYCWQIYRSEHRHSSC